ncbi:MAG TPA: Asp-tRNA(Asn)/Glu-tRNA(Gln) amidotransferase subunit GatA [Spirochaetota bacterium]|nr:Asp-tRNA(Asn)/Glu-tRNA(Gln) amidotransferase subunit GatA [Spirochaetota bacterium]HPC40256.1 Asp-tRNA(Asn)/Glu-tRNA(Gln) amidotransferase subunit GatA [Spirochaetota bacterium]HPL15299.1 Asp-tRNA(Asn)/Glu-tRNA(Gln) amidotransferase subunit GatA [Spirochaetota bacterium]HQF07269.1 Asp-tRNA(Asn)/Glu-tRNA(Gln) amidotransferase subunit GatA [Spirochaetota bacterium]HQJ69345.1 Asp-tRNA(Asn)/Glu-tRNA(Gln) amidotransferase subunit GatA [Spirochaetota bacterium]
MTDLTGKTSEEILALVETRELSCEELVRHSLSLHETYDPVLGCFISVYPEEDLLDQARESDRRRASGAPKGPLDGIPVAVKDNIHSRGAATTCASAILEGYMPPYDATAVARIKESGGIIFGKTNLDEFAMGSTCENSSVRITRNPWDIGRVPGGSSGGSAAAVAAGIVPLALGSDTGGSIRQPAAFCGIAGHKPTYGLVSRYGLVAYASSLDQIGPLARDTFGCSLLLRVISGFDPHDSTSLSSPPDFAGISGNALKGTRIAALPELFQEGVSPLVREQFENSLATLRNLGATVEQAPMASLHYAISAYYFIACAEAASNLSRYDGVKYGYRSGSQRDYQEMLFTTRSRGFGREVKKRILLGNFVLSSGYYDEYYRKALKVRAYIRDDMMKLLQKFDAIVIPTTPDIAFPLGESQSDPMKIYLSDVTTVIANLAGLPALSVPAGMVHGMPAGLQFIGRPLDDGRLIAMAGAFEKERGAALTPPMERILENDALPGAAVKKENGREEDTATAYTPEFIGSISKSYMNRESRMADRAYCGGLAAHLNKRVTIGGWIHRKKSLGGIEFYELRDRTGFTQLVLEGGKQDERIGLETVVEVIGKVTKEDRSPFDSIEIKVESLKILGKAEANLPVPLNRPPGNVTLPTILDNRTISLRNPDILRAFRLQSEIVRLFTGYLHANSFTEIKSPKIISSGTEGGTNIFKVNYFGRTAFLAQSPQFYKQIMVGSGLERVFEVGPVFRAEHHDTIRHLNEYISMDFEMGFIRDEQDVIDMQEGLLRHLFDELIKNTGGLLDDGGASLTFPGRIPRIHYLEALEIIRSAGGRLEEGDISPEGEKILCSHFEREKGSQFVYVIGYPVKKRPMYTMPDERVPGYTRSFDLLYRGIEITTGGQRIHDYEMLKENMKMLGFNPAEFRHYLEAFRFGMPPHGGLGMGLERLTMKIMNLKNIREASLFPRDINRITP